MAVLEYLQTFARASIYKVAC